ncbi:MAG: SOS response-associated peptidase family protein [Lachnospiraceae bacterium]|nr:SOS response-associated peptidase family protein [Lachnospiraceae bacterium]
MCTRYYIEKDAPELKDIIAAATTSTLANRFIATHGRPIITEGEVRPTDIVPVIAPNQKGVKTVFPMQWGFTNKEHNTTLFNARCETAGTKPTFKDAWKSHRCIVPASYYFEWEHFKSPDGKTKTGDKYAIQPEGLTVTWLCGLYRMEEGYPVFVVLTKEPTETLRKIHDRMPLILPQDKIEDWINPDSSPDTLLKFALNDLIVEKTEKLPFI